VTTAKPGTVYVLVDPRDNRVRYVGATTQALKVRLKGHMASPTPRIKAWVDGLVSGGLAPRIEPINENVPEGDLWDLERAEITRRLIAREPLLNESATATARRQIERKREHDRVERDRAAWEYAANQIRDVVGGPLAPGDVPPIPLDDRFMRGYEALIREEDKLKLEDGPKTMDRLMKEASCENAREKAADNLWRSVQPLWGALRGMADEQFNFVLGARVRSAVKARWADLGDASRYLALLPWGIVAVSPWAALAERAGMDISGSAFIDWVTDDADVREALTVLLVRSDGRMGPLSVLDEGRSDLRPSSGLLAMTAAHHSGFQLPQELHSETKTFLETMLRGGQLTTPMADLLVELDPRALDNLLGPEITAGIDARLGLAPGTSRDVLAAVLEKSPRMQMESVARIVDRAKGALPTVEVTDFGQWYGNGIPMMHAIIASLTMAGVLTMTPRGKTPAELVSEVRTLWCADLDWLEQTA
jgi:hypothetical protein